MATLYECMFIIRPTIDDDEVAQVVEQAKDTVTSGGGEVVSSELMGRRRLAYEIDGNTDGLYALLYFHASQEVIQDLRHEFQLSTDVMRAMVVKANERAMSMRATVPAAAEAETAAEPEGVPEETEEPQAEPETEPEGAPEETEEPQAQPETEPEPETPAESDVEPTDSEAADAT